jgi:hypothetical protein
MLISPESDSNPATPDRVTESDFKGSIENSPTVQNEESIDGEKNLEARFSSGYEHLKSRWGPNEY